MRRLAAALLAGASRGAAAGPSLLDASIDAPPWVAARDYGLRAAVDGDAWDARLAKSRRFQTCDRERNREGGRYGSTDCEGYEALARFFWRRERGVVLELGGLDGIRASESLLFDAAAGFRRVVVDASPAARPRRRARAAGAAGVVAAICDDANGAVHWLAADKFPEVRCVAEFAPEEFLATHHVRAAEAFANASRSWARVDWTELSRALAADDVAYETAGPAKRRERQGRRVALVACASLTEILVDRLGVAHVDFAILDVEGAELEVLRTIDWRRLSFGVLCVETGSPLGTRPAAFRDAVVAHMAAAAPAYALHGHDGRNTWFVNRDFVASARPPS